MLRSTLPFRSSMTVAAAAACVLGLQAGCASERKVEKDPEAIQAALEEHKEMASREAAEAGGS